MKKIYFPVIAFFLFALIVSGLTSCSKDFLEPTEVTNLNSESVFRDSANTVSFLAGIYSKIAFSMHPARFGNGGTEAAVDEAHVGNTNQSVAQFWATGTISPATVNDDAFNTCYQQIRAVNLLLKNISKTKFTTSIPVRMRDEAKFLRAWYYSILLKHYGGVPLIGDTVYAYNDDIKTKRDTYEDCVNYIVTQLDSIVTRGNLLTASGTDLNADLGRATIGACLALKARVLLYAASPLFSDDHTIPGATPMDQATTDEQKALVGYPNSTSDDVRRRWDRARSAATDIANLAESGTYKLYEETKPGKPGLGFQTVYFKERANKEFIWQVMRKPDEYNNHYETYWMPPTRSGANGAFPYQEFVDAFPMLDGKPRGESAYTYSDQNPYANRDPRLNYSVIHDQTVLPVRLGINSRTPVNIFLTNNNGRLTGGQDAVTIGTATGYYINKMIDTNATANDITRQTVRCPPLLALPEVYLNLAETVNEMDGSLDTVLTMLKRLRKRAGIESGGGTYGLKSGMSKVELRKAIQLERQIELAFQDHRFWDVRRWKIAPETQNKLFHGMMIVHDGSEVTYSRFAVNPKHTFTTPLYLWPIPLAQIQRSTVLLQNPGY